MNFSIKTSGYTVVTEEADPNDPWDNDNTETHTDVEGLIEVRDGQPYDVCIDDGPLDGLYLLYVTYTTGDSFHTNTGVFTALTLHRNVGIAHANAQIIQNSNYKNTVKLRLDNGNEIQIHSVWTGYFEHLENVTVEPVKVLKALK